MSQLSLEKFDAKTASNADFAAITDLRNSLRAEIDPSDPPRSVEQTIKSIKHLPPIAKLHLWLAKKEDKLVGLSNIVIMDMEENKHLAQASIQVLPEYRQQGVAKKLLQPILEVARANNKQIIIEDINNRVPAGEHFVKRLNASAGLAMHVNQLLLSELDKDKMQAWQKDSEERAQDFELMFWEGKIPEAELEAYCQMKELMNTQPLDDLEVEDMKITPEFVRQIEAHKEAKGEKHWTVIAKHKPTGEFAGFTETGWNPDNPITLQQEDTAVMPKYRGNGLGKWVKAAMITKLTQDLPQLERVRTGNANSNNAMLKINHEMGFKPFQSVTLWQIKVDDIETYLSA